MDLRKSLFGSIVLSGSSTLTKGFGDRLLHEVQRLAVKDMRIKIFAPPERKYTTWIGGSILAGLSTFKKVSTLVAHSKEKILGGAKNGSVSLTSFPTNTHTPLSFTHVIVCMASYAEFFFLPFSETSNLLKYFLQMWVEKSEWQDNPDIIHTKFA